MSANSVKTSYWSKLKKKNITKQVNLNKFSGDEDMAREFLENWKKEQIQKEMDILEGKTQPKKSDEEIEEKKEALKNEKPEQSINTTSPFFKVCGTLLP